MIRARAPRSRVGAAEPRGYLGALLLAVVVTGLIIGIGSLPTLADLRQAPPTTYMTVRVEADDTVWDIAERYAAPGVTTADTVTAIRTMNDLADARLSEGQLIQVPSADADLDGHYAAGPTATP